MRNISEPMKIISMFNSENSPLQSLRQILIIILLVNSNFINKCIVLSVLYFT